MKKQVNEIALLLGLAVGLALCVNFFSPVGIALVGQWDISKGVITAGAKNDAVTDDLEIKDVKVEWEIFNSGTALFVDARRRESYEEGHIPGAVSFPVGEFDMHIEAFMNRHSPEQAIVTYCSGRTCEDSHELAQLFLASGFMNVKEFSDGFPGWVAEGYPIE
jgi:rhodanese-related sulfurtransferase